MLPTNLFQLIYSDTLTYIHLWLNCYCYPTLSKLSYLKTSLGSWVQVCFILKHLSQESVLNNVCEFLYLIKMGNWVFIGLSENRKVHVSLQLFGLLCSNYISFFLKLRKRKEQNSAAEKVLDIFVSFLVLDPLNTEVNHNVC